MLVSISELSKASGVSSRTLRWYHEIGLLEPVVSEEGGVRHYNQKAVEKLQEILFYRSLNFSLDDIKALLEDNDISSLDRLRDKVKQVDDKIAFYEKIKLTIHQTIQSLDAKITLDLTALFSGFREWSQCKGEKDFYIAKRDNNEDVNLKIVLDSAITNHETAEWTKEEWQLFENRYKEVYQDIANCLKRQCEVISPETQEKIKAHYVLTESFHRLNFDVYYALANVYQSHAAYMKQLRAFHLQLPDYISKAMKIYALNNL